MTVVRRRRLAQIAALALLAVGVLLLVRHDGRHTTPSSGVEGSGVAVTESRKLPPFSKVDLAGANSVAVHVDGAQAVTIRGDDNVVPLITTEVRDGELVVGQRRSFTAKGELRVEVSVPSLDAVTISGAGVLDVDGVRGSRFTVSVPGTGMLTGSGAVEALEATLAGSGELRLQDLAARDVTARLSGTGRVVVNATRTLDASLSGSGLILYSGAPSTVSRDVSGVGAVVGE
jgi:putative autotransporter adhesin-like protein